MQLLQVISAKHTEQPVGQVRQEPETRTKVEVQAMHSTGSSVELHL